MSREEMGMSRRHYWVLRRQLWRMRYWFWRSYEYDTDLDTLVALRWHWRARTIWTRRYER